MSNLVVLEQVWQKKMHAESGQVFVFLIFHRKKGFYDEIEGHQKKKKKKKKKMMKKAKVQNIFYALALQIAVLDSPITAENW